MSNRLSRRHICKIGAAVAAGGSLVSACDLSTQPAGQDEPTSEPGEGQEAPELAARVRAGEIPPVQDRLPSSPLVVDPVEATGEYGGEWNTALYSEGNAAAWLLFTIGYEYLVRWKSNSRSFSTDDVVPNVAEGFEFNEKGTEYVFTLREGVRWSDGEPFTVDDIIFWYEDVFMNDTLTPVKDSWLTSGGEPVTVEPVDSSSVMFKFGEPNALFLPKLARAGGMITSLPRHYLERFHENHNPDIDMVVEEAGAADWAELFHGKGGAFNTVWENPDMPTLNAWILTKAASDDVGRVVAERNPYYWKVDPDGRQLPYIDRVVYTKVSSGETLVLKAMNGEMDFHFPQFEPEHKPTFARSRESGDYHFFDTLRANQNQAIIALNLTHQDPARRRIFSNKEFRIGLSQAINREELIDVAFSSQGEPFQAAPRPESQYYDEQLAKQYTEYDVASANTHLDRAGLTERDSDGIRLGPDGGPISFVVDVITAHEPSIEAMELVRDYWREVGIDINVNSIEQNLFHERRLANEPDATVWFGGGGLDVLLRPQWYFPFDASSNYAIPWGQWYASNGADGEEPPDQARRQMELYDQLERTPEPSAQADLMKEILQIAGEEFYTIGLSLWANGYGIQKNDFHNVPSPLVTGAGPSPATANPCQFYRS